jgi:hypothetical protein
VTIAGGLAVADHKRNKGSSSKRDVHDFLNQHILGFTSHPPANITASTAAGYNDSAFTGDVFKRQDNVNSTCNVFGIDFQNGGSYFINTASNSNFTAVTQFEGCDNATASVQLVDNDSGDQYYCSSVLTVPNDVSQISTCPILKSQIMSGNWSILTLGNNGDGNPFAVERDFVLTAGKQKTSTITPTVTYTYTSAPLVTSKSESFRDDTSNGHMLTFR